MLVREAVDERLVAQAWERQAFDRRSLQDLGYCVVFRGIPSDAGGPDYQDAILASADGTLLRGDIEFHVLASDWRRHRHHLDRNYDNVVLHVVWRDDTAPVFRQNGETVPTIALAESADLDRLPSPGETPILVQHPCLSTFSRLSPPSVAACIAELGWIRFAELEGRFVAELESEEPNQVLYGALLEGLGYASNRQVFRRLAESVPYGWLMTLPVESRLPTLLCAAGFSNDSGVDPPARLPADSWRLTRLRPANHPAIRIEGIMDVISRLGPGLAVTMVDNVSRDTQPATVRRALMSTGDAGAIGKGRADELAVSVVLPFVAALEPTLPGTRGLYSRFPSPPSTRWTRAMTDLLARAGLDVTARTALQHQGLHLLYTRYCRREAPADCPICGQK